MYYSEKARRQKVKELVNNKEFMDYAHKRFDEMVMDLNGYGAFDRYLVGEVFTLYDDFTLLQFLKGEDDETINRTMKAALDGLNF